MGLTIASPSGAAITVPGPFNSTMACKRAASSRAARTRSSPTDWPASRSYSPAWGVSTAAGSRPLWRARSTAGIDRDRVRARRRRPRSVRRPRRRCGGPPGVPGRRDRAPGPIASARKREISFSTTSAAPRRARRSAVAGNARATSSLPGNLRRPRRPGHRAHDHARAAAQRGAAREHRRADHAVRAADDEAAGRPLVGLGAATRATRDRRGRARARCAPATETSIPMSTTSTRPACVRPGSNSSPGLYAAKQIVSVAHARPRPRPHRSRRSTPDGMSTASTGTPTPSSVLRRPPRPRRRARPRNPVPYIASITRSARASTRRSSASSKPSSSAARRRRRRGARSTPRRDATVGAVVALAGDDRDPAAVRAAEHARGMPGDGSAGPLDEHRLGRAARSRAGRPPPSRPASAPSLHLTASSDRPAARPARSAARPGRSARARRRA